MTRERKREAERRQREADARAAGTWGVYHVTLAWQLDTPGRDNPGMGRNVLSNVTEAIAHARAAAEAARSKTCIVYRVHKGNETVAEYKGQASS